MIEKDIPAKANLVLNWILVALILIAIRIVYLTLFDHERHLALARAPQRKTIALPPDRGTIRDRYGQPLAINKVYYNASIRFDPIRNIPKTAVQKNAKGAIEKIFPRNSYIKKLAGLLGEKLKLDPGYIEDLIYSKAMIFPHTPFIIKEGLTEKEYYALRLLERDYPGIETQMTSKRFYPQGKLASQILGYMGAIHQRQFLNLTEEKHLLEEYLKMQEEGLPCPLPKGFLSIEHVKNRLLDLQVNAYRFTDVVGRMGIEKRFDDLLRGKKGQKEVEVDPKGRVKREFPQGWNATAGKRIYLNISAKLQSFAEKLLIENETLRDAHFLEAGKDHNRFSAPWIKGGAILAIIPKTGEVVAMASYPRFDPNDFNFSSKNILKWLENDTYISQIWDGKRPLEKEILSKMGNIAEETKWLSWNHYLDMVLSLTGSTRKAFSKMKTIQRAVFLQNAARSLLQASTQLKMSSLIDALFIEKEGHIPSHFQTSQETKEQILSALKQHGDCPDEIVKEMAFFLKEIPHNDDKLLFLDLCRLCIDATCISEELLQEIGSESLSFYRKQNQAFSCVEAIVKKKTLKLFEKYEFPLWREKNFQVFIKEKRIEEKKNHHFPKPYLDYAEEKCEELFKNFWISYKFPLIECYLLGIKDPLFPHLHPFFEMLHQKAEKGSSYERRFLREYLLHLSPHLIRSYLMSMRNFSDLNHPLWGKYTFFKRTGDTQLEKHLASAFYPPSGFSYFRSHAFQQAAPAGSLFKIVTAYEALRQNYLKRITGQIQENDLNPLTIIDDVNPDFITEQGIVLGRKIGGELIPRLYKGGRLPRSYKTIGRVGLLEAMERSSNLYFSLLAGDVLDHPTDLLDAAKIFNFGEKTDFDLLGETSGVLPQDLRDNRTGLYAFAIGQHAFTATPLQISLMLSALTFDGNRMKPHITQSIRNMEANDQIDIQPEVNMQIFLPMEVKNYLLGGLHSVLNGPHGAAHGSRIRYLYGNYELMKQYLALQKQMIGKTSTAEVHYRPSIDRESKPIICKHIWFGGVSFESSIYEDPELAVVVYLRYGDFGKEAAPLAAQIISKWREVKKENAPAL